MPAISTITAFTNHATANNGDTIDADTHFNTPWTDGKTYFDDYLSVMTDLEKNYASGTQPTDKPEGKIFADTSNDPAQLKFYKDGSGNLYIVASLEANNVYTGSATFPDGSAADPAISGTTSTVEGLYFGQNFVGIAANGVAVMTVTAATDITDAVVAVLSTEESTSPTTGALTVGDGLGVAGAAWIGGLLNVAGVTTFQAALNIDTTVASSQDLLRLTTTSSVNNSELALAWEFASIAEDAGPAITGARSSASAGDLRFYNTVADARVLALTLAGTGNLATFAAAATFSAAVALNANATLGAGIHLLGSTTSDLGASGARLQKLWIADADLSATLGVAGVTTITDATGATSITTGALKVTGGISSQENIYAERFYMDATPDDISMYADGDFLNFRLANSAGDDTTHQDGAVAIGFNRTGGQQAINFINTNVTTPATSFDFSQQTGASAYTSILVLKPASVQPGSDSAIDLGLTGTRWRNAFIDTLTLTDTLTAGGHITLASGKDLLCAADGGSDIGATATRFGSGFFDALTLTGGTGSGSARVGGTLHSNGTAVGNVGAGEDDLMSYTLPADTLDANGDALVIRASGTNAVGNKNSTVKIFWDGGGTTLETVATGSNWQIEIVLIRTGASTGLGYARYTSTATTAATSFASTASFAGTIVIKFTGENLADATNDVVTQEVMLIEYLPTA